MSRFTVTPWRTQTDLLQVRQQLYRLDTDGPDLRQHAVDRVMAWKLRGNLPHAVESTALLIDAVLHHYGDVSHANSIFSVRAVYSAAFARFVTGFCDIGRSKERSLEPISMLEMARQIDMPAEFVGLRHEATHEELPALRRLVQATEEALRWLWNAYWSRLSEPDTVAMTTTTDDMQQTLQQVKAEARQILRSFRSTRRDAIRAGKHQRPEQAALISETSRACASLCDRDVEKVKALAGVLVEDKLLSPSKRELGSSLEGAYLIWDGFLQRMWREQPSMPIVLIHCLLGEVTKDSTYRSEQGPECEAYCWWLKHIVDSDVWQSFLSSSEDRHLRKDMMEWCCVHPGHWSQFLGSKLIEDGGPHFKADWEDIFIASRLQPLGVESSGVDAQDPANHLANSETSRSMAHDPDGTDELSSWTRTVIPPHVPIGVVR